MGNEDRCRSTHLIDGDGSFNVAGIENFAKEIRLDECGLSHVVVAIMGPQSSDQRDNCSSTHLIDVDGTFNVAGVQNFAKEVKLAESGLSYAVVAIMGPQSSGKSTLLNHLFGTNFREMDAEEGRSKTTDGLWLAHSVGLEPCTLVMDLEGSDGRERGEDDTFKKQIALFALAVSDIVLINIWCHDIGREQAANRPLLKTVFQVMTRLFSPRKTTLMFVIRDKTRTPLVRLERVLREDMQKIWNSFPKPQAHKGTLLNEFFNVEVVALSSYEEKEEQFKEQVASLRQRFFYSTAPGGLAGDRRGVVPGYVFSFSSQQIWKIIKENKDLDLSAHKVMIATVRCEAIANEKFSSFIANEEWCQIEKKTQSHLVPGFGWKITSILDVCLSEYDAEVIDFDEDVRSSKRKQLEEKLLRLVRPAYESMLRCLLSGTLDRFKEAFDNALNAGKGFAAAARDSAEYFMAHFDAASAVGQANWDSYEVREELRRDIEAHIAAVRIAKLSELTVVYETRLREALTEPIEVLLKAARDDTWATIRAIFRHETGTAVSRFSSALRYFEIEDSTKNKMVTRLEDHARGVVEAKAKEEAKWVSIRLKDRFSVSLLDSDLKPRVWTGNEDIQAIIKTARSASLKLLSIVAAIRLDDYADSIENTLSLVLVELGSSNSLDSSSWDGVPASNTLLTPFQCKSLWIKFETETESTVKLAKDVHARAGQLGENDEKKKAIFIGPWGGLGGNYWDDGPYSGVREIVLVYGSCIDSIRILYDKNGLPLLSNKHGGRGGSTIAQVKLQFPDECLIGVSGYCQPMILGHNAMVRSLTFKSNRRTYGPFGVETGTPFSLPIEGGKIVGFRGRCGSYIDAIGFHISPA